MAYRFFCIIFFFLFGGSVQAEEIRNTAVEQMQQLFHQLLQEPQNIKLHLELLHLQLKQGEVKAASASLERLRTLIPYDSHLRLVEIDILIQLNNFSEALYLSETIDTAHLTAEQKNKHLHLKK